MARFQRNKKSGCCVGSCLVLLVLPSFLFLLPVEGSQKQSNQPYRLGNFGVVQVTPTLDPRSFLRQKTDNAIDYLCNKENHVRFLRLGVFLWSCKDSFVSVMEDTWELERKPDMIQRDVHNPFVRRNVQRRVDRDRRLRRLVGAGYTPRLVWLYGVMLRGVFKCTAIPKVFNPPIGWGAGAALAAKYAVREWLPCILLGWYGSDWYWRVAFGVRGAPGNTKDFQGVPITIHKVRF
jgi:hypothetical protein